MKDQDGRYSMMKPDHILSHISDDERYYVPSLLARAAERFGVSRAAQHVLAVAWNPKAAEAQGFTLTNERSGCFGGVATDQLRKALQRLLYEEIGTGC
jgi:hypothetical protein